MGLSNETKERIKALEGLTDRELRGIIDKVSQQIIIGLQVFLNKYGSGGEQAGFLSYGKILITAALVDGKITPGEMELIRPVLAIVNDGELTEEDAMRIANRFDEEDVESTILFLNMIKNHDIDLFAEMTTLILCVLAIDKDVSRKERAFLKQILQ